MLKIFIKPWALLIFPSLLLATEFSRNYYSQTARPLFKKYCFQCHNQDSNIPFYARPIKSINPFYQNIVDGLKALDMTSGYPGFKSKVTPSPLTLLQEIKNTLNEETMPPKTYSFFHGHINWLGFKKGLIHLGPTLKEKEIMINWAKGAQKLITRKKTSQFQSLGDHVKYIFEKKCQYCHNPNYTKQNGALKNIMDLDHVKKNYLDPFIPKRSKLYQLISPQVGPKGVLKYKMPGRGEPLTSEEIDTVLNWIKAQDIK